MQKVLFVRAAGHALDEPEDSPFYGDGDGMIIEGPVRGHEPTWVSGKWLPAKYKDLGGGHQAILAVRRGEPGEKREDWLELAKKEHEQGVMHQYWILDATE